MKYEFKWRCFGDWNLGVARRAGRLKSADPLCSGHLASAARVPIRPSSTARDLTRVEFHPQPLIHLTSRRVPCLVLPPPPLFTAAALPRARSEPPHPPELLWATTGRLRARCPRKFNGGACGDGAGWRGEFGGCTLAMRSTYMSALRNIRIPMQGLVVGAPARLTLSLIARPGRVWALCPAARSC